MGKKYSLTFSLYDGTSKSVEFEVPDGPPGPPGPAPTRGVDYWTAEDKAEIVAETIALLPTYNGEVEAL